MNLYRFHWSSGKTTENRGNDPADALTKLGYGAGAVGALDYWELVPEPSDADPDSHDPDDKHATEGTYVPGQWRSGQSPDRQKNDED